MKKIIKWLLILWLSGAVIAWLVIALVFNATKWVGDAADKIVQQFKAGQVEEVYNASVLSDPSQNMSLEEFKNAMGVGSEMDITKATFLWWHGRWFENGEKYIYGDFMFVWQKKQTLTFRFVEDEKTEELVFLGVTWWVPDSVKNDTFDEDFDEDFDY